MQVSAGFDAHWRDPLEQLNFQSATYHKLVSGLRDLADELCGANQFLKAVKQMASRLLPRTDSKRQSLVTSWSFDWACLVTLQSTPYKNWLCAVRLATVELVGAATSAILEFSLLLVYILRP